MSHARPDVPAHLRRFVVEQDYAQYNAVDRAVWRFLLLQVEARLVETAHPAYRDGLAATGISPEHIPHIAEVNDKLSRFGWGAVCVDGFIPPRAFQEFQANGILPIAADVRSRAHLVYTPAPDIFHEAAGHAPILPDPVYAAYLRRIGELGKQAFTLPGEDRLDQAIYALSEKKEDPALGADEIARAEADLTAAIESLPEPSEAARLSRLYWWTVEYGLVGRVDDYKLYGAGLLSSLGESHSCHAPAVGKLPLDVGCTAVSYDITRPQPQLFVAASFDHLHDVLGEAARDLAVTIGGPVALGRALASRELGSFGFSSGAWVIGVLGGVGPELAQPAWLEFEGSPAIAWDRALPPGGDGIEPPARQVIVTGRLADGGAFEHASARDIDAARDGTTGRHHFRFATSARVQGRLMHAARRPDGRLAHIELADARLDLPGRTPELLDRYVLVAAGDFLTAHAGAADPRFHPDSAFSDLRVPKPRAFPADEQRLMRLFSDAESAHDRGVEAMNAAFPDIHAALVRDTPHEWLLRWNLLESLLKVGDDGPLSRALRAELEALEVTLHHDQPIASGLNYLARRAA